MFLFGVCSLVVFRVSNGEVDCLLGIFAVLLDVVGEKISDSDINGQGKQCRATEGRERDARKADRRRAVAFASSRLRAAVSLERNTRFARLFSELRDSFLGLSQCFVVHLNIHGHRHGLGIAGLLFTAIIVELHFDRVEQQFRELPRCVCRI